MQRPRPSEIPDAPGAYMFRDEHGKVIYVGKAKSLRKRVTSHFGKSHLGPVMVESAEQVEWVVTANEVEAIMLEYSLIQRYRPRFNYRLRDDKSYPYLAIDRRQEWPRPRVMRGKRRTGVQYFGPYAHVYAIRSTLDLLLKVFPVRTCTDRKFRTYQAKGRPCLLFDIGKCSAPCVGAVDRADYEEMLNGLSDFLQGNTEDLVQRFETKMMDFSDRLEFEQAARVRDQLTDVRKALSRQEVVTDRSESFDVVAFHDDDLEASVQVLKVRKGRLVGRQGAFVDKVEDLSGGLLTARMLLEFYGADTPPPAVLVQELPLDTELWKAWLKARRGSAVALRVPQRGAKRRLLETAQTNATDAFSRRRLRRQSDPNARAQALRSLQQELDLPLAPLRIEAFDISTLQGTSTVASMVVMEDGLPRRSDYRHFKIRTVTGQDDFAAMEEVIRRRFEAYLKERELPVDQRGRFAYPPSLIVIDGGAGQLGRAVQVLESLRLDIPVIGLAKRMEEVYLPNRREPVRIPRDEPALYLLQRVRDEAHRFAIEYHRRLRSKSMVDSILDDIPGVGPKRKRALIRRFGSLKRIREADLESLAEVLPRQVAQDLYAVFRGEQPSGKES